MGTYKMSTDAFTYWVERRIKEANLRDRVKTMSGESKIDVSIKGSGIHDSFWTLFKSGARAM